jgi:hypothetical protein
MTKKPRTALLTTAIVLSWMLFTVAFTDLSNGIIVTAVLGFYVVLLVLAALILFIAGAVGIMGRRWVWFVSGATIVLYLVSFWAVAGVINESTYERSIEKGSELVAAIEEFRVDNSVYPESLSALIPEYLDSVPSAQAGIFVDSPFGYYASDSTFRIVFPRPAWMLCTYDSRHGDWVVDD